MPMKKSIKITIAFLVVAIFINVGLTTTANATSAGGEIIVGAIFPLSGAVSEEGNAALVALKVAEENINQEQILPEGKQIKLLVEDGKYTAKDTIAAYHKLRMEGANVFIVLGDVPSYSLAKLVDSDQIPIIACVAEAENVPYLSKWIFRSWYSTNSSSKNLATFAASYLKAKRAATLAIKNNYGDESVKSFEQYFTELGQSVVYKETYDLLSGDCRNQVAKVLSEKPDLVFVPGYGPGYISCLNQLQEAGYPTSSILTVVGVSIPRNNNQIHGKGEGMYFNDIIYSPHSDNAAIKAFVAEFREKTGKDPYSIEAFSYVSLKVLTDVIKNKGTEPEQIREGLATLTEMETIVGPVGFEESGECTIPLVVKKMLADGMFELVAQ